MEKQKQTLNKIVKRKKDREEKCACRPHLLNQQGTLPSMKLLHAPRGNFVLSRSEEFHLGNKAIL